MPFIKSVGAVAGDTFCVRWDDADEGSEDSALPGRSEGLGGIADAKHQGPPNRTGRFIINDVIVGPVFAEDSRGRPLPRIEGCRRLKNGEFLPLSTFKERSFDGRYYGAVLVPPCDGQATDRTSFGKSETSMTAD